MRWSLCGLLLSFFFCLAGCEPLQPSGRAGSVEKTGDVKFALGQEALQLLRTEAVETLRVRVFSVKGNRIGTQEGNDSAFPLSSDDFKVTGLFLGRKKFQLHVLDAAQEVVGEAEFIHVVRPGPQTWDEPIVIRLRPANVRRALLKLTVDVTFDTQDHSGKKDYVTHIKPYLEQRCVFCHTASPSNQNGIDLTSFPFTYSGARAIVSQSDVVLLTIQWLKGEGGGVVYNVMPPFGTLIPADTLADFELWLQQGLLPAPQVVNHDTSELAKELRVGWQLLGGSESGELLLTSQNGAPRFEGQIDGAIVSSKYDLSLSLLDTQGQIVHTEAKEFTFDDEPLNLSIKVPYSDPEIVVPVVVVRD